MRNRCWTIICGSGIFRGKGFKNYFNKRFDNYINKGLDNYINKGLDNYNSNELRQDVSTAFCLFYYCHYSITSDEKLNICAHACQNAKTPKWHAQYGSPMRAKMRTPQKGTHNKSQPCVPKWKNPKMARTNRHHPTSLP